MPTYEYSCDECGHNYEEFRPMTAKSPDSCPKCKNKEKFRQVLGVPNVKVEGSAKTFGQASEENLKRLGTSGIERIKEEKEKRVSEFKGKLPKGGKLKPRPDNIVPPWRDGSMGTPAMDKPLDIKTVKDVKKYIKTGNKQ
jgi:putative FmdB family regulatory protein